jgi:hypothetical protein
MQVQDLLFEPKIDMQVQDLPVRPKIAMHIKELLVEPTYFHADKGPAYQVHKLSCR